MSRYGGGREMAFTGLVRSRLLRGGGGTPDSRCRLLWRKLSTRNSTAAKKSFMSNGAVRTAGEAFALLGLEVSGLSRQKKRVGPHHQPDSL